MTSHIAHRKKSGICYVHRTSQSDLCDAINPLHSVICLGLEFGLIVDSETCKSHLQCTNVTVNTVTGNTTASILLYSNCVRVHYRLESTTVNRQCTVYSVQCTVYSVQCTVLQFNKSRNQRSKFRLSFYLSALSFIAGSGTIIPDPGKSCRSMRIRIQHCCTYTPSFWFF